MAFVGTVLAYFDFVNLAGRLESALNWTVLRSTAQSLHPEVLKLERVKILDPSFLNWRPLSYALLKNIVPDFPLCNKSFNQSYSRNEL